ncbi:MAG: hypothetical protein IJY46_03730 [Lentisphaeria bacterium]|nr:hypothetical protein [Lentisphaeria bacterium]
MSDKMIEKLSAVLKAGSPVITAADVKHGVMEQVQLYFEADGEAVMDVINKDDLVQNFPDEGVYVLNRNGNPVKLVMFEGEEDMYFRTDGTTEESDEFADVPSVAFMSAVEALSTLKL